MGPTVPTIWLVRHGESTANAGLPSSDPASIPLTEFGLRQARAVSELFTTAPELVIASTFARSRQTADAIVERHPMSSLEVWPVQEFTFLGSPAYRDTTVSQRQEATEAYWRSGDPRLRVAPDAESFAEFCRRLDTVIADLKALDGRNLRTVVVVSHRKFISGLIWRLLCRDRKISSRRMARCRAFDSGLVVKNASRIPILLCREQAWVGPVKTTSVG